MATGRVATLLAVVVVLLGLVAGFVAYVNLSTPVLHTKPEDVSSVMRSAPLPRWTAAAETSRRVVRENLVRQNLPGVSVAVGVGGDIVWAEGFGWADLEQKASVTPETRFRIGHVSQALTSAGVGLLREKGRLHLDAEIQDYVPAFPRKQWPITLRQLMGHVAGVRHYKDTEWGDKPSVHCERASDGLSTFADDPLLFAPDSEYRYSTYGWVLVSAAVEAVAGVPFADFMRTRVFEPLGMTRTSTDAPKEAVPDRATSYFRGNLDNTITTAVDYSCFAGGGAFLSTPSDLVRFGAAVMNSTSGSFLQADTVRVLQTRQSLTSGKDTDYGLGWTLETVELGGQSTRLASSASRTIEGASTSFMIFPERGLVVAVTSNMSFADMRSIAWATAQAFAEPLKK